MRKQRKYAPFVKVGKRWKRLTWHCSVTNTDIEYSGYTKEIAVRRFQNWLLAPFLNGIDEIRELRPVKD